MFRYRTKPVEVQAIRCADVLYAVEHEWSMLPDWVEAAIENGILVALTRTGLTIKAPEGDLTALHGDWIVQTNGQIRPCKADVFAHTYERFIDGERATANRVRYERDR